MAPNEGKSVMTVREVRESDAESLLRLLRQTLVESEYLPLEPDELTWDTGSTRQYIRNYLSPGHSTIIVSEEDQRITGYISVKGQPYRRVRHNVSVTGMAVLQEYWGKGTGQALIRELVRWAKNRNILRIELNVATTNQRAVNLYKKMGFDIEGVKLQSLQIDKQLKDEYLLVKFVGEDEA